MALGRYRGGFAMDFSSPEPEKVRLSDKALRQMYQYYRSSEKIRSIELLAESLMAEGVEHCDRLLAVVRDLETKARSRKRIYAAETAAAMLPSQRRNATHGRRKP